MAVGTIGAIGNGLALPLTVLPLGQIINSFGSNHQNSNVVEEVSKTLKLREPFHYSEVTSWMVTGERQVARIRGLYLKTILRQDRCCFFDTETSTGGCRKDVGDMVLIQDVIHIIIVGTFMQLITTFILSDAALALIIGRMASQGTEIDSYDPNGKILEDIQGEKELRGVCFICPARPEELIFNGFSLHRPCGTTAALVGESGSGKSTVISLVERFYDPQADEVLIDGINMKEFQLSWIRGKIGLVGLSTMVGEHGTQLSSGQKQRIAIARAIPKNLKILLLKEATSALDAESERIVQEALDRIMVNKTNVVVAHRLSTVRNADNIVVIHGGKIVEKGTHSELLKDPEGAYS
uniref:ABC transporter B family member 4 n=1 Tax=Cajanus cajan TaxID=3821 RepID=A0A151SCF3_CAJCA|nr:ABC transporter B family member 4 [Cajanus cajan]